MRCEGLDGGGGDLTPEWDELLLVRIFLGLIGVGAGYSFRYARGCELVWGAKAFC